MDTLSTMYNINDERIRPIIYIVYGANTFVKILSKEI